MVQRGLRLLSPLYNPDAAEYHERLKHTYVLRTLPAVISYSQDYHKLGQGEGHWSVARLMCQWTHTHLSPSLGHCLPCLRIIGLITSPAQLELDFQPAQENRDMNAGLAIFQMKMRGVALFNAHSTI